MIEIFIRKIKSAYSLTEQPQPIKTISSHITKNMRQVVIQLKRKRPFTYYTSLGIKFLCLPNSDTSVNLYVNHQDYEETEFELAYKWLEKGDCCLDLGANIGYFSTLAAAKVSQVGKVIAVEASPQTSQLLNQAIQHLNLKQVYLEEVCVSDKDGLVEFMVSCDNSNSDVSQSLQVDPGKEHLFQKITVPSTSLNSLIEKHQIHENISLVKMDIEAAEPLALRSGSVLFNKDSLPLFIVEVYKLGLQRLGFEPKDIFSFFPSDIFELYHINRSYPNPNPEFEVGRIYPLTNPEIYNWPWHTNLIAIPKTGKYSKRKQNIINYLS